MVRRGLPATHLAGWLFADLVLVLFLAALVSLPPPPPESRADVHPSGSPSGSPSPSAASSPSPGMSPTPVLELQPVDLNIPVPQQALLASNGTGPPAEATAAAFHQAIVAKGLTGRAAGLVLTFGAGDRDHIAQAEQLAKLVNAIILAREPGFAHAQTLEYWGGESRPGTVSFKLYFFAR